MMDACSPSFNVFVMPGTCARPGGVDFLDADADGYRKAGEALLETGVTAYLPTLITSPEQQILAAMREVPISEARPRILGMHLEGPFLSPNRLTWRCSSACSIRARCA